MGDFLSTPNKEKHSEDGENASIKYGACGMQGWRLKMEDAHISDISQGESSNCEIFGVFDGHGGKEVAQFVKSHFTKELLANASFKSGNIDKALKETFLRMDELMRDAAGKAELLALYKQSKEEGTTEGNAQKDMIDLMTNKVNNEIAMSTGCTACVCVIDSSNKKIYYANAGDSRVVLCQKGIGQPKSEDHKPELEGEKSRIYKADGWINSGRVKGNLNLSRCLGDLEYKQNTKLPPEEQMITSNPDIIVEDFNEDNEFIIVGCDGIWDCLTNQEACDFVKQRLAGDPQQKISGILEEMVETICAKDIGNESGVGCDNMTCLVVLFKKK